MEMCGPHLSSTNLNPGTIFDCNTMPLLAPSLHCASVTFISQYSPPFLPEQLLMGSLFKTWWGYSLSSLFSWPPQGHSTSSKERRKNLQCSVCEVHSRIDVPYLPSQADLHVETGAVLNDFSTSSLTGISDPDALLRCVNADASVPQHKSARAGGSSWNSCSLGNYCFHNEFWVVFRFFLQLCWHVKQPPDKQPYSPWQANVAIQRWLSLQPLWKPLILWFPLCSIGWVVLSWEQNDSPWGSSSVWFECKGCRKRASYVFPWWENIFKNSTDRKKHNQKRLPQNNTKDSMLVSLTVLLTLTERNLKVWDKVISMLVTRKVLVLFKCASLSQFRINKIQREWARFLPCLS